MEKRNSHRFSNLSYTHSNGDDVGGDAFEGVVPLADVVSVSLGPVRQMAANK